MNSVHFRKNERTLGTSAFWHFWVKMVAKNIVRWWPGTHFMHIRVKIGCKIFKNIYFQEHLWTAVSTGHNRKNYPSTSFTKVGLHNYYLLGLKASFVLLCSYSFSEFILWKYFFLPSLLNFFFWTNWLSSWNFFP